MTKIANKITMSAIAKKAGVSIASVSRVIHTPHLTSREVQEKVNQVIQTFKFDATSAFKPYASYCRSKKIMVIDNQLIPHSLINKGIEQAAKQENYKLLYFRFFYFSDIEIQQIVSYTINHQLDGIIVINNSPYLQKLLQYRHALPPIVLVNQFTLKLPSIYFDHLSMGYLSTQHLISKGHKKIAILLSDNEKISTHHFKSGYIQALTRANIAIDNNYMVYNCCNEKTITNAVKILISLPIKPTALICSDNLDLNYIDNDKFSLDDTILTNEIESASIKNIISLCQNMNIDIPSQLTLFGISYTKTVLRYYEKYRVNMIHKPLYQMGTLAVKKLLALLENNHIDSCSKLVDFELLIR